MCDLDSWRAYDEALLRAKEALAAGKLAVLPTDTLYGLCANAFDDAAVEKVFQAKMRDERPIAIIVSDLVMMQECVEVPDRVSLTLQQLMPGPFTAILKAKRPFSKLIAPEGKVGIRIPHFIFTTTVARQLGFPLTATSANLSGGKSPYKLGMVPKEIMDAAEVAVDGGPLRWSNASTVIDFTKERPEIIRRGACAELAEGILAEYCP